MIMEPPKFLKENKHYIAMSDKEMTWGWEKHPFSNRPGRTLAYVGTRKTKGFKIKTRVYLDGELFWCKMKAGSVASTSSCPTLELTLKQHIHRVIDATRRDLKEKCKRRFIASVEEAKVARDHYHITRELFDE